MPSYSVLLSSDFLTYNVAEGTLWILVIMHELVSFVI